MSRRTPNERLALFLERADRLTRARGIKTLFRVAVEFRDDGERNLDVRIEEPDEDALLALVVDIRRFDNPKAALYVPAIITILRVDADARTRTYLDALAEQFPRLGRGHEPWRWIIERQVGRPMSFRQVFELWVYSQLLHDDTAKDREWRSLNLAQQSMAKMVAYSYMADLVKLVAYITEAVPGRPEQSDETATTA